MSGGEGCKHGCVEVHEANLEAQEGICMCRREEGRGGGKAVGICMWEWESHIKQG